MMSLNDVASVLGVSVENADCKTKPFLFLLLMAPAVIASFLKAMCKVNKVHNPEDTFHKQASKFQHEI